MARRTLSRLHGNRMSYSGEKINTKNKNRINDQRDKGGNGQWRCILCQRALKWFPQHQLWENNSRDKKKKKKRAAVNKSNCKRKKKQKKKRHTEGREGRDVRQKKKKVILFYTKTELWFICWFLKLAPGFGGEKKRKKENLLNHTLTHRIWMIFFKHDYDSTLGGVQLRENDTSATGDVYSVTCPDGKHGYRHRPVGDYFPKTKRFRRISRLSLWHDTTVLLTDEVAENTTSQTHSIKNILPQNYLRIITRITTR